MTVILCDITATRKEVLAKAPTGNTLVLSLADVSSIKIGSILTFNTGTAYVVSVDPNSTSVSYYVPQGVVFSPSTGDTILIESVFRFASEDITMQSSGTDIVYEGRLSVPNINESFGSFMTRNQVVANATIDLVNTDQLLSSIFHNYDLEKSAKVQLLFGETNNMQDYTVFFSGIGTPASGFAFNDTTFTFSAKDNRETLLSTPIPANQYNSSSFPEFAVFNVGSPVVSVTVSTIPAGWAAGSVVKNSKGASAVISYIDSGTNTLFLYKYNGVFTSTSGLGDIFSDQGGSTVIVAMTSPLGTGVVLKGDSGRFLSNIEDVTPVTNSLGGGTTMAYYTNNTTWGFFHSQIPLPSTVVKTFISTKTGYLEKLDVVVGTSTFIKSVKVVISSPSFNVVVPNSNSLLQSGAVVLDLASLNLRVNSGETITISISSITTSNNSGVQLISNTFSHTINSIVATTIGHYNTSGSITNLIPFNFTGTTITGPGNLFFSRSSTLTKVFVSVSSDSGLSFSPIGAAGADVNSGVLVPETVGGAPTNMLKVVVQFTSDPTFRSPSELYGLEVQYPTNVVVGTTLDSNAVSKPIPVVYGDFRDTKIPVTKLSTVSDKTLGAQYNFTSPVVATTNSLDYAFTTSPITSFQVGDTLEYTAIGHSADSIFSKITQVIENVNNLGTGTVYFEDFGIVPIGSSVIISRETNTYKIADHPITSLDAVFYKPKSSKKTIAIPTTSVVTPDLANGEFSIVGVNSVDPVFVSILGKPKLFITGTAGAGSYTSTIVDPTATFITDNVPVGTRVTHKGLNVTVNVVSVDSETQLTTEVLPIIPAAPPPPGMLTIQVVPPPSSWLGFDYSLAIILENPIDILNDMGSEYGLGISVNVKGGIRKELETIKFRNYIDKPSTFGDVLSSIELSSNTHISITSNNVLTMMRFTDSIVPEITYFDHNVVPNSLDEVYDPDGVAVTSVTFQYDFNAETKKFGKDYFSGSPGTSTTMVLPWLYRDTDAKAISDQVFKVLAKLPEIVHVTIADDNILSIKLGDIIEVSYLGLKHTIFVYDIIRIPSDNQVELYGWVLSNAYNIDFPIPDLAEFPTPLMESVGWNENTYTFEPQSLIDKRGDDTLGNPSIERVASFIGLGTGVTTSISGSNAGNPIFVVNSTTPTVNNPGISLGTKLLSPGTYNVSLNTDIVGPGFKVAVYLTPDIPSLTGETAIDITKSSSTLIPFSTVGWVSGGTLGQVINVTTPSYLVISMYDSNGSAFSVSNIQFTPVSDINRAYDRYNWWNPTWPFLMKQYVLDRYTPPTPICGYLESAAAGREYINTYKS